MSRMSKADADKLIAFVEREGLSGCCLVIPNGTPWPKGTAMSRPPPPHAAYLGDGVYAWSEEGLGLVWVSTERDDTWLHIALEPPSMAALISYARRAYWYDPEHPPDRSAMKSVSLRNEGQGG